MKDLRSLLDAIVPVGKKAADADEDAWRRSARRRRLRQCHQAKVGTIQRQLLVLENQGGEQIFR